MNRAERRRQARAGHPTPPSGPPLPPNPEPPPDTSGMDPDTEARFLAMIDMFRRTGARDVQIRYQDDEQPVVWIAVATFPHPDTEAGVSECAAGLNPAIAAFRLGEQLMDGAMCTHCKRPTGIDESVDDMPLSEVICWYQYDPELRTYRRSCE